MPRPQKCRRIQCQPRSFSFKPAGIPLRELVEVQLSLDELESMRLVDLLGLYQEAAALEMEISRATLSNTLASAHKKVAQALIHGQSIRIQRSLEEKL